MCTTWGNAGGDNDMTDGMNAGWARHRLALLASVCAMVTAGALAGCGGDDAPKLPDKPTSTASEVEPSTSPTATPSVTAPPSTNGATSPSSGVDLDRTQQSAYEKALADHGSATRVLATLNANPRPNQATADRIKTVSYNPFSEEFYTEIQRYAKAGARVTGDLDVRWRRPVAVDLDAERATVIWEQCTTIGTTKVLIGNRQIPQSGEAKLGRITQYADEDGFYRIGKTEEVGACD